LDARCKGPELTYETARDAISLRNNPQAVSPGDEFELLSAKLLERYPRDKASIHLHLRMGAPELDAKQFCTVFASPNHMGRPLLRDELGQFIVSSPAMTENVGLG